MAREVGREVVPAGSFASGGSAVGSLAGRALGTLIGGPGGGAVGSSLGGLVGKGLGSFLSKIAGFGSYHVMQNSIGREGGVIPEGVSVPTIVNDGGGTIVRHAEFLQNIVAPASPEDFTLDSFDVNPGDPDLFPWLSQVAKNYQQWRPRGMIFVFRSTSSDITAGGALGTFAMSSNYNSLEATFTNMRDMLNAKYAVSGKPSRDYVHTIECARSERPTEILYVKGPNSSDTLSQDANMFNLCKFQYATEGLPSGLTAGEILGELWISYEIELMKPVLTDSTEYSGYLTNTVAVSKTAPLGTGTGNLIKRGKAINRYSSTAIQMPITGNYVLMWYIAGTGITGSGGPFQPVVPIGGGKYNNEDVWYSLGSGLDVDIDAAGTSAVGFATIRARAGLIYDLTATGFLGAATTITACKLFVFGANFEVLYGDLASFSLKEIRNSVKEAKLANQAQFESRVIAGVLEPLLKTLRDKPHENADSDLENCGFTVLSQEDQSKQLVLRINELETRLAQALSLKK